MDLKDTYSEVGTNYRFFLTWRHKLLAGFLVTIAGLAAGFSWAFTNQELKSISWVILLLGILITAVFWALDFRNRALYRACQNVGHEIEKSMEANQVDKYLYGNISKKTDSIITHSFALNLMFGITIILLIIGIIVFKCKLS